MKTKFPHLVQQKAPQEYAKICGLRSDYTLDTVSENWNIIFQQNIERQKIWRSSMGEKDGKLLYKKKTREVAYRHKKQRCHIRKGNTVQKAGNKFWGKLEKGNWGTKTLFQEVFGEAQLKLCSCEEAATRAPSVSSCPPWSFPQKIRKVTQESLLSGPQSATKHWHYPEALELSAVGLRSLDFPGRRCP